MEHIRDEHPTCSWLLEPMIERCGFEIEDAERSEDGFFAAYVARAVRGRMGSRTDEYRRQAESVALGRLKTEPKERTR